MSGERSAAEYGASSGAAASLVAPSDNLVFAGAVEHAAVSSEYGQTHDVSERASPVKGVDSLRFEGAVSGERSAAEYGASTGVAASAIRPMGNLTVSTSSFDGASTFRVDYPAHVAVTRPETAASLHASTVLPRYEGVDGTSESRGVFIAHPVNPALAVSPPADTLAFEGNQDHQTTYGKTTASVAAPAPVAASSAAPAAAAVLDPLGSTFVVAPVDTAYDAATTTTEGTTAAIVANNGLADMPDLVAPGTIRDDSGAPVTAPEVSGPVEYLDLEPATLPPLPQSLSLPTPESSDEEKKSVVTASETQAAFAVPGTPLPVTASSIITSPNSLAIANVPPTPIGGAPGALHVSFMDEHGHHVDEDIV